MPIAIDLHTHTLMSGHAYSTLEECCAYAASAGMRGLAVTDHAPAMPGGPIDLYFLNLTSLPRQIAGALVLRGAEANIMDFDGRLDLSERALKRLDICIASYHDICFPPGTAQQNTAGWEAVIQNPYVDILGHPGRGEYPFDIDHVVRMCGQYNKVVEINNHTLERQRDHDDCLAIARACLRHQVPVILSSDAHFSGHVGRVPLAEALLAEIDFPDELILNRRLGPVIAWLKQRKPRLAASYDGPAFADEPFSDDEPAGADSLA